MKLKTAAGQFFKALSVSWQVTPLTTAGTAVLIILQGLLPLLQLYLVKLMVDAVSAAVSTGGETLGRVLVLVALAGGVTLAVSVIGAASSLLSEIRSQTLTDHVQGLLHTQSINLDMAYYENPAYFDTMHRAQSQGAGRFVQLTSTLFQVFQAGFSLAALGGLLLTMNWVIAVVMFAAALPALWVRVRFSGIIYRWEKEWTQPQRKIQYYSILLTAAAFAKEIRLFGLGEIFRDRYTQLRRRLREERIRLSAKRTFADVVAQGVPIVALFATFAFLAREAVQGRITLGDLVLYYQAFQRGQGYLAGFFNGLTNLYENQLFLTHFFDFLSLPVTVKEPEKPAPFPKPLSRGIVFEGVGFSYPGGARTALTDISFSVKAGEHVALVGKNGAGKTTIIKLLCRFYDPTAGRIIIDGTELRSFSVEALRRNIGILFQDFSRYFMTVKENIWFGDIGAPPEGEPIREAARRSGADAVIAGLPEGYDTLLGKMFDRGEEISVGEWQKVALARAFLRRAQILALDEPTSALDVVTEYELFQRFRQLSRGKTVFLIGHRLSTVRNADKIVVLDGGRLAEMGDHASLMARKGIYAELFSMQAESYR